MQAFKGVLSSSCTYPCVAWSGVSGGNASITAGCLLLLLVLPLLLLLLLVYGGLLLCQLLRGQLVGHAGCPDGLHGRLHTQCYTESVSTRLQRGHMVHKALGAHAAL